MRGLKNRVAIVTGAAGGIGVAICRRFIEEGISVIALDVNAAALADLHAKFDGREALLPMAVDIRDFAEVDRVVRDGVSRFGRLDILVNNAGIDGYRGPVADHSTEAFDDVVAVNLRGVFFGMKHAIPVMLGQRSGRIFKTASQLAH